MSFTSTASFCSFSSSTLSLCMCDGVCGKNMELGTTASLHTTYQAHAALHVQKNDYEAIAGHGDGIVRKGTNCRWWEQDNDIVTTLHHSVSVNLSLYSLSSLPPTISHSLVLFFSRSWTRVNKQVTINQSRMFWGVCKYRLENCRRNRSLMTRTMPWRDFFSPQLFSFSCVYFTLRSDSNNETRHWKLELLGGSILYIAVVYATRINLEATTFDSLRRVELLLNSCFLETVAVYDVTDNKPGKLIHSINTNKHTSWKIKVPIILKKINKRQIQAVFQFYLAWR